MYRSRVAPVQLGNRTCMVPSCSRATREPVALPSCFRATREAYVYGSRVAPVQLGSALIFVSFLEYTLTLTLTLTVTLTLTLTQPARTRSSQDPEQPGSDPGGPTVWGPTVLGPRVWGPTVSGYRIWIPKNIYRLGLYCLGASRSRATRFGSRGVLAGWGSTVWGPTIWGLQSGGLQVSGY